MANFIYVFSTDARDALLNMGYTMLKEDGERGVFVFANEMVQTFSRDEFQFALSNTLTF